MSERKIALVTGANRGIGFEICRQLAEQDMDVILTARDAKKAKAAAEKIDHVRHHTLDVTELNSLQRLVEFVESEFGRLDILINNAGIYIDHGKSAQTVEMDTVRTTLETNLLGPLALCQAFIPLMKKHDYGRIINISSGMGAFNEMGGGYASYRISKAGLNALTVILASELAGTKILVNAMCPGWVRTEMGGKNAPRSVEKGADTAVWLALLPNEGPTGKFFRDRKEIVW